MELPSLNNREIQTQPNQTLRKARDSNFELLRLFAMFLITIHHLVINSIDGCGYNNPYNYNSNGLGGVFCNSLAIVGVNLFVMISGYFGIKRVWRPIFILIIDCVVYGLILCFLCSYVFGYNYKVQEIVSSIDFRNNWFVCHYIFLVLLSPILEASLKECEIQSLNKWVLILTFGNIVLGYVCGKVNVDGYNAYNFVYLYIMGRWVYFQSHQKMIIGSVAAYGLVGWLVMGVFMTSLFLFLHNIGWNKSLRFWSYNAPWVVISSLFLFIYFSSIRVKSKYINLLARSSFGVYILQSTAPFFIYRKLFIMPFYVHAGYIGVIIGAIVLFISLLLLCFPYSMIRDWILTRIGK